MSLIYLLLALPLVIGVVLFGMFIVFPYLKRRYK